jgi:hypothetical protein
MVAKTLRTTLRDAQPQQKLLKRTYCKSQIEGEIIAPSEHKGSLALINYPISPIHAYRTLDIARAHNPNKNNNRSSRVKAEAPRAS